MAHPKGGVGRGEWVRKNSKHPLLFSGSMEAPKRRLIDRLFQAGRCATKPSTTQHNSKIMNVPRNAAVPATSGGLNAVLTTLVLGLAVAAIGGPLQASGIVESSIQTSSRSGGSITTLTVTRGQPFYFSITAASTDTVVFWSPTGRSFTNTLGQLQSPIPFAPFRPERVPERLSDGRTRLFFVIEAPQTFGVTTGSTVQVRRGATNIDTDPITVR